MTSQAVPGGLMGWVLQNGQLVLFFAQLLYWIVIAVVAIYAVIQLKRFVDNACGVVRKGGARAEESKPVSVEEFTD